MTFSQSVKSEILKSARNLKGLNATSFLTAVLKSAGSLTLGAQGFAFSIESDNLDFITLCRNLAKEALDADVKVDSYNNAKGQQTYTCELDATVGQKLGLTVLDSDGLLSLCQDVATLIPSDEIAKRSFMQGLFVAGGSVVIPMLDEDKQWTNNLNTKYHLELRFTDQEFAEAVSAGFSELSFHFLSRKSHFVLYLKDSEKIADFMVFVNATAAKFTLEEVIIRRSMRNDTNRQTNCITANIGKTVAASGKQLEAINLLRQKGTFDSLPDQLKDIALLREKYVEATLDEIADMLSISKSGANHRFAKLIELSKQ